MGEFTRSSRPSSSPPSGMTVSHQQKTASPTVQQSQPHDTKNYFKLLQAIHHSEIINDSLKNNSFPKGITHKVLKMSRFIKPASSSTDTSEKIQNNINEWVRNNFTILREHYDQVISTNLLILPTFQLEAYHRALKWARTRYGHKLTTSSINILRSMTDQVNPFPPLPVPAQEMPCIFTQKMKAQAQQVSPPKPNRLRTTPTKHQVTVQAQVEIPRLTLVTSLSPKERRENKRRVSNISPSTLNRTPSTQAIKGGASTSSVRVKFSLSFCSFPT